MRRGVNQSFFGRTPFHVADTVVRTFLIDPHESMFDRLRRLLNRLEVDQAVFFSVAVRAWQLVAGPVVMLLVASYFAPDTQGFYFTFTRLLGLQAFVELGLRVVLLNVASHEWASLGLDEAGRIVGDPSARQRLVALGRASIAWFCGAALVFAAGVGAIGVRFFATSASSAMVEWRWPWIVLVVVTSAQIVLIPLLSILDGCRQMPVVNCYRFVQAVTATLAGIACIVSGSGLWTGVGIAAARLFWDLWIVAVRYRRFFAAFRQPVPRKSLRWREEILPLQWRLAVQSLLVWFAYSLFEPVLFQSAGAIEAGRFGLTWAALTALQAGALAWVDTRVPLFGGLVARRDFVELDRVFFRVARVSFALLALGVTLFCAGVWGLELVESRYAARLLPSSLTALLGVGLLLNIIVQDVNFYLRAHRKEPAFLANLVGNAACGWAVWWCGNRYGSLGAAAGFTAAQGLIYLPWCVIVWKQFRRREEPPA